MNNRQVAHIWANQSRPSANGSHFYFEGATIYSYGSHFPIARHCTDKKGNPYILMTTKSYSPSTARHVSYVRQAIPYGMQVFQVEDPLCNYSKADLRLEFKAKKKAVLAEALRASRARTFTSLEHANRLGKEANDFAEFFGLKERVIVASPRFRLELEKADKRTKKEREAAKARQAARAVQQAAEAAERAKSQEQRDEEARFRLEMWKRGEHPISSGFNRLPVALRVNKNPGLKEKAIGVLYRGALLETSHGASVPAEDAAKAVRFVSIVKKAGIGWHRNGETCKVGDFQLDSISATGDVVAGCHRIAWDEVERIGKAEGWL
jgi:hypothetical protein